MTDASVRATAVDGSRGGWIPDVESRTPALETPVSDVGRLETVANADPITVVPDAHYPFHPSTGMVTDPAVVAAVVTALDRRPGADVTVAGASDDRAAFERTASYLGYRSALDGDAALVDLADESRTTVDRTVGGDRVTLSVPTRLLEGAVVVVPTLRPTASGPVAGGMRTLGALVDAERGSGHVDGGSTGGRTDGDRSAGRAAAAATRAIDPARSILDATTVFAGDPRAANVLFGGEAAAVDAVASSLLERPIGDDGALEAAFADADSRVTVGVEPVGSDPPDLESLRSDLPSGDLPPSDGTHPAVTAAYRLYAAVGGDAVPPQLEADPR